ncbi:EKC/KEOPS complex subunit Tprkb-like [Pieris rapae]|uniref:EKC/KEOPS complex subunit Tprkb-like n=1 Tax=Pieris rapae TaxID=64459 RepID=UPI001E27D201|nr:EKC/KEOPS complex subunit Tprkb-like [Pieris rapae]
MKLFIVIVLPFCLISLRMATVVCSKTAFTCHLDPISNSSMKLILLKNVQNVNTITENIKNGVWKCAAINPSLILDPFQVAVAANRAVVAQMLGNMVTKSVYGEILYNLSLTKNITQSLTKFGVYKQHCVLLCFIIRQKEDHSDDVLKQINGELCPISDLNKYTDLKQLQDAFKLDSLQCTDNLLDSIVSRMVTKNIVSFNNRGIIQ